MKGKIKVLSLIMAVALTGSMFAACSGNNADQTSSTSSTASTASSTASNDNNQTTGEVTEISWHAWGDPPNQREAVEAALNEKSIADIGIKVNFKWTTGDDQALRTALSSGDSDLDIAFACAWFADYVGSAQKNFFTDLTDIIPTVAPDLWKELPETLWNGVKVNGKIYGVPVWKDVAATQYWLARKDIAEAADAVELFHQAGLKVDSLTPALEKIKAWHDADPENNAYSEGNTAPFNFNKAGLNGHNNMWDALQEDVRIGIRVREGNTTVQSYYTDADYIDDLKTLKKWADAGLSNGKVALQIEQEPTVITVGTAQGWDGAQYTAWGGPVKGYDTIIQQKTTPIMTSATVQGGVNVIGAGSKKVEAALKFMEYVNTNAEYRNMLTFGIEGVNFKDNGDGTVTRLTGQDWAPGNFALGSWKYLKPEAPAPADMNTGICEQVNTAEASALLGFAPNTDNVKTQIASCTSIIKEVQDQLQCGAVQDVDATVAKLLSDLDGLGYNDIIADYQAQVDAFLAAK